MTWRFLFYVDDFQWLAEPLFGARSTDGALVQSRDLAGARQIEVGICGLQGAFCWKAE